LDKKPILQPMIYVTGANGQLGQELKKTNLQGKATFLDRSQLDLSNLDQLEKFLQTSSISTIINTAAYTQVDKAEAEQELALTINAKAPALMAKYASERKFKFIHYSTDYVFNGEQTRPYHEADPTNPVNFYGETKLQGEQGVLSADPSALILRTSWVYSAHGKNFFNTMIRLAGERPELKVVADQIGTPTATHDLALITLKALDKDLSGIFHFSNEGVTSWYDFACEILRLKGLKIPVHPIKTSEFPTPAKRPAYSVLDKTKIKNALGEEIPDWREALQKVVF
jgi:dTDP-4-dehydrorhamnose reductase